jgi:hypothetical protein
MKKLMLYPLGLLVVSGSALASPGQTFEVLGENIVPYRGQCQTGTTLSESNAVQLALLKCMSNVRQVTPFADSGSDCRNINGGTVKRTAKFECLPVKPENKEKLVSRTFQTSEDQVENFIYGYLSKDSDDGGVLGKIISDEYVRSECNGPYIRIRPYLRAAKPVDTVPGTYEVISNSSYICNEQPELLLQPTKMIRIIGSL